MSYHTFSYFMYLVLNTFFWVSVGLFGVSVFMFGWAIYDDSEYHLFAKFGPLFLQSAFELACQALLLGFLSRVFKILSDPAE